MLNPPALSPSLQQALWRRGLPQAAAFSSLLLRTNKVPSDCAGAVQGSPVCTGTRARGVMVFGVVPVPEHTMGADPNS